ncbi:hypothetical protein KPH14_012007 [Odynerus spinipes]|uniref:Uncharacterized protein n=1 Tax=Odynerus spinipes TaxID=1348599 RepID=A0AAD9RFZ1_9HYME|nr:hypothetical protein KPH14_012007 [Odynerus spinipes]
MHQACYKSYSDKRLVEVCRRNHDASRSSLMSSPVESHELPTFDFKNYCFICTECVDPVEEKKRPINMRRRVSVVTNSEFRDTVFIHFNHRKDVLARIENVPDLTIVEARYHRTCWNNKKRIAVQNRPGRPISSEIDRAMEYIYNYIDQNSDECQFTLQELIENIEGDFIPDVRTIKKRLKQKYIGDILIFDGKRADALICFPGTGHKLLSQGWYEAKKSDPKEERLRVIREAAAIIVEDIRSKPYNTKSYPPSDNFLENVDDPIPISLNVLLTEIIFKSKRGSLEPWKRKCTSLAHAIISAVRPRSFISSLKIGVGALLYKKFGSKNLIKVLSSLGFCSSYEEISMLEAASIMRPQRQVRNSAFTQFVYDNADYNINTLDGHGTFHCMGGIQCITPFDAIEPDEAMNRDSEKKNVRGHCRNRECRSSLLRESKIEWSWKSESS